MGTLIGKRGQTLDSLQYLVSLVVNKGIDGYIHVKADTENYRERRKQTLENLAKNIASKVKRSRKPVTLEPMNPYERRIIHSSLQNDRFVTTYSEGEEPYRRVIVTLKKQPRNRRNSDFRTRRDGSQPVRETKEFRNENPTPTAEAITESLAVTEE
jgi:spoIIIJ-associated protein